MTEINIKAKLINAINQAVPEDPHNNEVNLFY